MSEILPVVQTLLRQCNYLTRLRAIGEVPVLTFEDDSVLGFAIEFGSAHDLITTWKSTESFVTQNFATTFRKAGEKAWNVYLVLLSASSATAEQAREIRWIEENLERTRKLAACGLDSRDLIARAIYPLLSLQHQPNLKTEDLTSRLLKTLQSISPRAAKVALDDTVSPAEVVKLLGETS